MKTGGHHPLAADGVNKKKLEKEEKLKEQKELAALFKPVQTQKVAKGKWKLQIFIENMFFS